MMETKEKMAEALDEKGITTFGQAMIFLAHCGIDVKEFKSEILVIKFPNYYKVDTDFRIKGRKKLLNFCVKNREFIEKRYEKWKQIKK